MEDDNAGILWGTRESKPEDPVDNHAPRTERFHFTGKGGEYFGIVFVNNFFNLLTLWFYAPWAKVRNLQYFYGNTKVAGGTFRFTANPWRMLRSRIIAVALLVLFVVADFLSTDSENTAATYVYFGLVFLYIALAPVLFVFVLSFRARYTEWRSIAFSFNKDFRQAYRVYSLPVLCLALLMASLSVPAMHEEIGEALGKDLSIEIEFEPEPALEEESFPPEDTTSPDTETFPDADATSQEVEEGPFYQPHPVLWVPAGVMAVIFLLLLPLFDFLSMRFMVSNIRLGTTTILFLAVLKDFYTLYGKYLLVVCLPLAALVYAAVNSEGGVFSGSALLFVFVLFYPLTEAYFRSKRYNMMINSAQFVDYRHRLVAAVPVLGLFWISFTNTLAIIISFGLLIPWARVRTVGYMLRYTELLVVGSLDKFVANQEKDEDALAQEVADVFDLDLIG
jgi:uncharacterized membrane protein YjgN (DUF898 family)